MLFLLNFLNFQLNFGYFIMNQSLIIGFLPLFNLFILNYLGNFCIRIAYVKSYLLLHVAVEITLNIFFFFLALMDLGEVFLILLINLVHLVLYSCDFDVNIGEINISGHMNSTLVVLLQFLVNQPQNNRPI